MNRSNWLGTALLASGLLLLVQGCDAEGGQHAPPAPAVPAAVKHEPTAQRALQRCTERWAKVCNKDWIGAYEFQSPEFKKQVDLGTYLQGKSTHTYANAKAQEVLKLEPTKAFVRASVIWTPVHPSIDRLPPEHKAAAINQELTVIETWVWADGDWHYHVANEESKFFEEHPEFLRAEPAQPK
jgi:hypothetical protein